MSLVRSQLRYRLSYSGTPLCKLAGGHVAYDGKVLGVIGYMFSSHNKGAHSRRNANKPDPNHRFPL